MKQWIFIILALAIAGATALWLSVGQHHGRAVQQTGLLPSPSTSIGGPFSLTDQNGHTVTDKDFSGRYLLIYFGYTFCPDACPTELLTIGQALESLDKASPGKAAKVQPIFITIDPARDTTEKLANYIPSFYPGLIGLTGSDAEIAEVAKEFKVYYARSESTQNASEYVMDHSSYVYLVSPQRQVTGIFSPDTNADDMAKDLDIAVQ